MKIGIPDRRWVGGRPSNRNALRGRVHIMDGRCVFTVEVWAIWVLSRGGHFLVNNRVSVVRTQVKATGLLGVGYYRVSI